jgi:hypothetical protein
MHTPLTPAIDRYVLRHLDTWLDHEIDHDIRREKTREAMLALIAEDQEYWGSQSWWLVYDHAKCDRFLGL